MVVRNFLLLPNAPSINNRELFHDCLRDVESHLAYVRCQTTTMLYPITYSDDVTSEKEASLLQPIQSLNCISLMLSMTCDTWNSSIDQRVFVLVDYGCSLPFSFLVLMKIFGLFLRYFNYQPYRIILIVIEVLGYIIKEEE